MPTTIIYSDKDIIFRDLELLEGFRSKDQLFLKVGDRATIRLLDRKEWVFDFIDPVQPVDIELCIDAVRPIDLQN